MPEIRQQGTTDRQNFVTVFNPDVHVDAIDQHLPTPPLGAINQRCVTFFVGDFLMRPAGERMGSCTHQLDPERIGNVANFIDAVLQIPACLADRAAYARHDLDRVEQQLLTNMWVLATMRRPNRIKDRLSHLAQITTVAVDKRKLPFDAHRRAFRTGKRNLHAYILPDGSVVAAIPPQVWT